MSYLIVAIHNHIKHALRTPNEAFFHRNPKLLGLGRQIGQINCGAFGMFLADLPHWDFELFSSSNHISPRLNRPQGCQGCQKNRKDLRITTMISVLLDFSQTWRKIKKSPKNAYFDNFCCFWGFLCNLFNFGRKLAAKRIMVEILSSFWFFYTPGTPGGG